MPTPDLSGLQRLCRLYGRLQAGNVLWLWDYATEVAVPATAMPPGSARHAASERARWTQSGTAHTGEADETGG